MSTRLFFISILFVFAFGGCASSLNYQYLAPEYRDSRQSNSTVLVLPYISKIVSPSQRELINTRKIAEKKPVTGKEIDLLESYLKLILAEKAIAKIIVGDESFETSKIGLELKSFLFEDNKNAEMFVPLKPINIKEEKPNYILIIEDIYFLKNFNEKNPSLGQGSREIYLFEGGIRYLLWDNRKMTLVSFGELNKKMKLMMLPTKDEYIQMLESFVSSIIDKSPLYKKEIRF